MTSVDAIDSVFETAEDGSYTVGGLVDKYDAAVPSPVATLTIEPTIDRTTYESVRLVPDVEGLLIGEVAESASGVFTVTVDVGMLADGETYLENGTYMFHALAVDKDGNPEPRVETDSPKITVHVKNSKRPAPEVLAITVDPAMVTNPDSGGPQGSLTLNAYTPGLTSPPTSAVRLVAKGPQDAEWTIERSEAAEIIDGQELADILEDHVNAVSSNKPVVDIHSTYQKWVVSIDTTTLADTITAESPAARDASKDENQYVVTGYAKSSEGEMPPIPGVEARFSVDNVDDVAPLGPTNVSVTSVDAIDSVFETAEDGSYTVGGLVDKYDAAVPSPVATLTIEPTADRTTYESVRLVPATEGLLIGEVAETAEGSGVFTVTVDVGMLADGETYLENGTYMFHALASDAFGNEQADDSETDGSKISVTVENSYRPAPEIFAITTDPAMQTNPDSGAPQGTLTLNSYTLGERTSPPVTSMRF